MRNNPRDQHPVSLRVISEWPRRVFAVGDIHGCYEEIRLLVSHLKEKHGAGPEDLFIFMGDYIDRGERSKDVISFMLEVKREWPHTVFIKGNHEDMLLDYLGLGGESGEVYLDNGGAECLKSYGIHNIFARPSEILAALPPEHVAFFQGLELGVLLAEFVFVHAGIRPDGRLDSQVPGDLMWIRGDFVHAEHWTGKTVVFGHTPFEDIFLHLPFKIGIDTGCVFGNKLSAVELVNGRLFQVDRCGSEVKEYGLQERLGG